MHSIETSLIRIRREEADPESKNSQKFDKKSWKLELKMLRIYLKCKIFFSSTDYYEKSQQTKN